MNAPMSSPAATVLSQSAARAMKILSSVDIVFSKLGQGTGPRDGTFVNQSVPVHRLRFLPVYKGVDRLYLFLLFLWHPIQKAQSYLAADTV